MTLATDTKRTVENMPVFTGLFDGKPDPRVIKDKLELTFEMQTLRNKGWSVQQVAETFGVTDRTVMRRISRIPEDIKAYQAAIEERDKHLEPRKPAPKFERKYYPASCPNCSLGCVVLDHDPSIPANTLECINCGWYPLPKVLPSLRKKEYRREGVFA